VAAVAAVAVLAMAVVGGERRARLAGRT